MVNKKIGFLFPGQGAQYVGMGKSIAEAFPAAREVFEEANDLLKRDLSKIIFSGPQETLTETHNSQVGIYIVSMVILKVLNQLFPQLQPSYCAGLSLGEYSALTAAKFLSFSSCLPIVQSRGQYMSEACIATKGGMAVILGLSAHEVEDIVAKQNLPHDLWVANFNCPGQVVISGTPKGLDIGIKAAKTHGAKRALPLQVHGAFHSGLMEMAEQRLRTEIEETEIHSGKAELIMNVTGEAECEPRRIKHNLIKQVTQPVRWEKSMHTLVDKGCDLFIEIGCGKVLSGFNKKIAPHLPTYNLENLEDFEILVKELG